MENLTYSLENCGKKSRYKYIYECIRKDIISGKIPGGEKLPSKRVLAQNLGVSVITIENAYSLLELEGFIYTLEKKGYYVSENMITDVYKEVIPAPEKDDETGGKSERIIDLSVNLFGADSFPFDSWAKISRRILLDREASFLKAPQGFGVPELRNAISSYLYESKGIAAPADRIIIGPGTEYLHHILIQLLGRKSIVAVEDPGYKKVGQIYESNGVKVLHIPVDNDGMDISRLGGSKAKLVHTSPSHHFPTGCVMPADRRRSLLKWAAENRAYIIEDDYDSEFRFEGYPIPTMYSMNSKLVIYMNTFTRSLAPSIRIAYMVLPKELMQRCKEKLSFYSGTVSSFEQYTLAAFIKEGYYERHIRRLRNRFRKNRDELISAIKETGLIDRVKLHESETGLHLIIETEQTVNKKFRKLLEGRYVKIAPLELYCYSNALKYQNQFLVCYGDYDRDFLMGIMKTVKETLEECQ